MQKEPVQKVPVTAGKRSGPVQKTEMGADSGSGGTDSDEDAEDGDALAIPAPGYDMELTDQFGEVHTLSEYKGKVIFLNFWATRCGPCRNEMRISRNFMKSILPKEKMRKRVILGIAGPEIGQEGTREGNC